MKRRSFLALAMMLVAPQRTTAHQFSSGAIEVLHPYLRATLPGEKSAMGYFTLRNGGGESDRLIGLETKVSSHVVFHRAVTQDGVTETQPIEVLEVPAGGEFALGLNGTHAELEGLRVPVIPGQIIESTLLFERAGRVDVAFLVKPADTKPEDMMQDHENGH